MRARPIFIAIAFVSAVGLAGLAVLVWLQPWQEEESVIAATIEEVTQACSALSTMDYDTVTTHTSELGNVRIESRFSGNRAHHLWKGTAPDGTLRWQAEEIRIGSQLYTRESDPDAPATWQDWTYQGDGFKAAEPLECFPVETGARSQSGPDVKGASSTEIHASQTQKLSARQGTVTDEVWVDRTTALPARGKRTVDPPAGADTVLDTTYSGFGTANTITAPQVGSQSGGNAGS